MRCISAVVPSGISGISRSNGNQSMRLSRTAGHAVGGRTASRFSMALASRFPMGLATQPISYLAMLYIIFPPLHGQVKPRKRGVVDLAPSSPFSAVQQNVV